MSIPVFRSEKRTVQRFVGLPGLTKARLWPTVALILDAARADHQEISDQVVLGALNDVLIKGIVAGHYFDVHTALGKLLGLDVPAGKALPTGEERKPPMRAAGR